MTGELKVGKTDRIAASGVSGGIDVPVVVTGVCGTG